MRVVVRNKRLRLSNPEEGADLLRWIANHETLPTIDKVNARLAAAHTSMNSFMWAVSFQDIEAVCELLMGWGDLPENLNGIRGNRIHALFSFISVGWQIYLLNGRSEDARQLLTLGCDFFRSLDDQLLEKAFFLQTSQGVFRVYAAHSALLLSNEKEQEAAADLEGIRRAFHLSLRAAGQRDVSYKVSKEFLEAVHSCVVMERVVPGGSRPFPQSGAELSRTEELIASAVRSPQVAVRQAVVAAFRSQYPVGLLTSKRSKSISNLRLLLNLHPQPGV